MDLLFAYLQQGFSAIFAITVTLGLLILVHEFGHFIVARLCGVRVEVFSIGFGKRIFEFQKGDTVYCISILPLGGYVKMYGDDPLQADKSKEIDPSQAYSSQPVGKRIAILLAGPLMNLFLAGFIFLLISMIGERSLAPVLGDIAKDSPAFRSGFRSGDRIVKIDEQEIQYFEQVQSTVNTSPNRELNFVVERLGGDRRILNVNVDEGENTDVFSLEKSVGKVEGLSPLSRSPVFGYYGSNSEITKLGRILYIQEINGQKIDFLRDAELVLEKLRATKGTSPVELLVSFDLENTKALQKISIPASDLLLAPGETFIADIVKGSPAEQAGLLAGDRIQKINDVEVEQWSNVLSEVQEYRENASQGLIVTVARGPDILQFEIRPKLIEEMTSQGKEKERFQIGIRSAQLTAEPEFLKRQEKSFLGAAVRSLQQTWKFTQMTALSIFKTVTAEISPKNIGGVVAIGQAATTTLQIGITEFMQMMAIISINLFLVNLLPIPLLDGGQLVFCFIEAIRGAPLSLNKMAIAQQVGFFLLVGLMLFAFFNDISRLIGP